jgi:ABC-type sugar transport system substrate-binding protein
MKSVRNPDAIPGLTRRRFLQSVAAGLAGAGIIGCDTSPPDTAVDTAGGPEWLAKISADQEAAARLGRAYLETRPAENDRTALVERIEAALSRQTAAGSTRPADPTALADALQQVVRKEYSRDAVVPVDGWVLSVTEARLYGLFAVLAAGA